MTEGHDITPSSGGYTWWYFDGISDDGLRAFAAIFFVGSAFSPDYARRIRRGEAARPEEHVAVNLALYDRGRQVAWVMSEYPERELRERGARGPSIAQSSTESLGDGRLRLQIRERSAPFLTSLAGLGSPVTGTVEIDPLTPGLAAVDLSSADGARHRWRVVAPRARVRVRFAEPRFELDGVGYHDVNSGEARLESGFSRWGWARFHAGGRTTVLYSLREADGTPRSMLVDLRDGETTAPRAVDAALEDEQRATGWGMKMPIAFGAGGLTCQTVELLERSPFYVRYRATLDGAGHSRTPGMGEYLDLDRFRARGIQFLLRFKMRRVR